MGSLSEFSPTTAACKVRRVIPFFFSVNTAKPCDAVKTKRGSIFAGCLPAACWLLAGYVLATSKNSNDFQHTRKAKIPVNASVFVDKAVKHNITVTGRAMGKENRVAKMPLGSLFIRTFDSYCSSCYNDDRKSLGGRYNGKIHHR